MNQLNADFFKNNRQKLVNSTAKKGIIIVPGNGQMQRSADTPYAFKQDSNFYYLTGVSEPCATLVIDTKNNNEWLMLPSRDGMHAIFDGLVNIQNIQKTSGILDIVSEKDGWKRLQNLANQNIFLPNKPVSRIGEMYTNPHRATVYSKIRRIAIKPINDIRQQLSELRMIKSPIEQAIIANAASITYQALGSVMSQLSSYSTEREVEAELTKQILIRGADGHAYSPIIAGGSNSCTLHYIDNKAALKNGNILLFDVGAELSGYSADISRTIVYGSKSTNRKTEVIKAVASAQSEIIKFIGPGLTFKHLAEQSEIIIANKLINLQLIPKNYTKADIRKYFPHSVTHFLGLDVHDTGDYTKPMQAGMVITVEPGIYISEEAIGVRIEDDVVITDNGAKILGDSLPTLV